MITEEQLKIWIRSKGGIPAFSKVDAEEICRLEKSIKEIELNLLEVNLFFYKNSNDNKMWLQTVSHSLTEEYKQSTFWAQGNGLNTDRVIKTNIPEIISEVRDYLISEIWHDDIFLLFNNFKT